MIIVSNRLPFTVTQENGEVRFTPSVGGVATGLRAFLESLPNINLPVQEYLWVGWPGATIADDAKELITARAANEFHSYPVFFSEKEVEQFYQGFCNSTIWPLFHYFPMNARFDGTFWQQYVKVNQEFCNTLAQIVQPDDVLWIHDYHLMLLPQMLRQHAPNVLMGFFLHIPFPSYEIFSLLPPQCRRQIVEGLLGANLIGFHTYDYMQDFLRCVLRILGYENNMGQILLSDHVVKADCFPMGIDFDTFQRAVSTPAVITEKEELLKTLGNTKIILSVDRLDYSKGIINRLEGFETLLEAYPEWRANVALIMIVVPSRIGVLDYDQMKKQIEECVGKINGKFGTISWTPIIYQFKALHFHQLVALYTISHVALVTPLRDGMNLIAKEYIASKPDKTGVLILSEMAGAAKELGEALIINPTTKEEIANAIVEALQMPLEEQSRRNAIMQHRLRRYNVVRWAADFINDLATAGEHQRSYFAKVLTSTDRRHIIEQYSNSIHRLVMLDYDGTLMPFVNRPALAKPTENILNILSELSSQHQNELVLISGRDKQTLQEWFGALPMGLVAEHGAWIKNSTGEWKTLKPLANDWKPKLLPILESYADRLPGAFVEEKEYSLVWHYRAADIEQGRHTAHELMDEMLRFTANIDVQVVQGKKIIEVRNAGINKGAAASLWLSQQSYDFILSIGDDSTDEDLFAILPETAFSIRVGVEHTQARFHVQSPTEVLRLLGELPRAVTDRH